MREEVSWRVQLGLFALRDSYAKLFCIPEDDDGGEQVEPSDPEVLAFRVAVSDFALPTNPQGIFQSMVRFTFIETNVGTSLHIRVERPFDDEECPFNPPDFAQGNGQVVLSLAAPPVSSGAGWAASCLKAALRCSATHLASWR